MSIRFIPTSSLPGVPIPIDAVAVLSAQDQTLDSPLLPEDPVIDEPVDISVDEISIDEFPANSTAHNAHKFRDYPQKIVGYFVHAAREIKAFFDDWGNGPMGPQLMVAGAWGVYSSSNAAPMPDYIFMVKGKNLGGGTRSIAQVTLDDFILKHPLAKGNKAWLKAVSGFPGSKLMGMLNRLEKVNQGIIKAKSFEEIQKALDLLEPGDYTPTSDGYETRVTLGNIPILIKYIIKQGVPFRNFINFFPEEILGIREAVLRIMAERTQKLGQEFSFHNVSHMTGDEKIYSEWLNAENELKKIQHFFGITDENELLRLKNEIYLIQHLPVSTETKVGALAAALQDKKLPFNSHIIGGSLENWLDRGLDLISLTRILPDNYLGLREALFDVALEHHEKLMGLGASKDGFQTNYFFRARQFSAQGIHKLGSYVLSTDQGMGASYGNQDAVQLSKRGAAVFDGVGGSQKGDEVSALAARVFQIMMAKNDSLLDAHDVAHAVCHDLLPEGSTTAVAFEIIGSGNKKKIVFVNNGDSGAMLLRKSGRSWKIVYETPAQSHIEDRRRSRDLRVGDLEARAHPLGHFVSSVLGGRNANTNPITHDPIALQEGDIVLMGSDGIFDNLSNDEILEILNTSSTLSAVEIHQRIIDRVQLKMQRLNDVRESINQTTLDLLRNVALLDAGKYFPIAGSSDCAGTSSGKGQLMIDRFGIIFNSNDDIVGNMNLSTGIIQIDYSPEYLDDKGNKKPVYKANRHREEIPVYFQNNLRLQIPGEKDAYMDQEGRVFNSRGKLIDFYKMDNKSLYVGVVDP
ncbi:MAG: hypothetical protein ACD_73C00741G0002 [uncultured bacterium]|nr:MAG: hypothetical protein ACD_73C00741G0002 [uncultured bacterium]